MDITNKSKSVLDRLRNQSKETNLTFQIILQLFAQEEFLRKLSQSEYNKKFVLKGGMFIYTLTNYESRPTKDVDFVMRSLSNELDDIRAIIAEICEVDTRNDFIEIEVIKVKQISADKEYPGARVSLNASIGNVRIPFSIDIGIDDIVIPLPLKRTIKPRLDGFTPLEIYTYTLESTVAEKLDAILQRMSATSRMKDFFDIYYLQNTFEFQGRLLCDAVKATTDHRSRKMPHEAFDEIRNFIHDRHLLNHWSHFEPANELNLAFDAVVAAICDFLEPVYKAIIDTQDFCCIWNRESQKWEE